MSLRRAELVAIAALRQARAARTTAKPGKDGKDGQDGVTRVVREVVERPAPPAPVVHGEDGVGIADVKIEQKGANVEFVFRLTNGKTLRRGLELPKGRDGSDGKKGDGPILQMRAYTRPTNIANFEAINGVLRLTFTDDSTMEATVPFDDYTDVEYLADQVSAGSVLTFTFAEGPVQKIWVEMLAETPDDASTARLRVDGVDPTATVGTLIHAGQVQPISSPPTTTVKVLAPAGKTITCYGYRR